MKRRRQDFIRKMIREDAISSQEEILKYLKRAGFKVSQPTVSRDLKELGFAKVRGRNGKVRYCEVDNYTSVQSSDLAFRRMAPEFLVGAEASGNIVVLRTTSGGAQSLAAALDSAGFQGIAGTVAGDDTIMVVCSKGMQSERMKKFLLSYTEKPRGR